MKVAQSQSKYNNHALGVSSAFPSNTTAIKMLHTPSIQPFRQEYRIASPPATNWAFMAFADVAAPGQ